MSRVLIYGANGYTGSLIAEEAVRRRLKPVLAGRNRDALDAIAHPLGLTRRVFDLDDGDAIARHLEDIDLVLNCAGPFVQTAPALLDAAVATKTHYLDITGEIDVFALCHRAHQRARHAGVVVLPGVGFDVVPTDGVAAGLKRELPDAIELALGFEAGGGPSPGTARTSVDGIVRGGRVRRGGEIVEVPLAWKTRTFERDGETRTAVTIPWGDVYTAFVSTGIPNIETFMAMSPRAIARLRRLRWLKPVVSIGAVRRYLEREAHRRARGPDAERRAATGCVVWGEARNAAGRFAALSIRTPNGYALTVDASLRIVRHVLDASPAGGYYTPSQMMGADFVFTLAGVKRIGGPAKLSQG